MAADRWKAGGCACLPACESPFSDSPRSQQRRNVGGSSDAIRALIGIKSSSARRKEAKGRDDRKPAGAKRSRTCRKHNACARRRRPVRLTRNTRGPCARLRGQSQPGRPLLGLEPRQCVRRCDAPTRQSGTLACCSSQPKLIRLTGPQRPLSCRSHNDPAAGRRTRTFPPW